ncbi:UNVERIFIED_ORG: hypothetical protein DFO82_2617 [Idiomarina abyssalis]|nr:hypothetical protein DEU30_1122 [Idiomarina sp. 017G]
MRLVSFQLSIIDARHVHFDNIARFGVVYLSRLLSMV